MKEPEEGYELRRALGTCCPEPSCDYVDFNYSTCKMCGAKCDECVRTKSEKKK